MAMVHILERLTHPKEIAKAATRVMTPTIPTKTVPPLQVAQQASVETLLEPTRQHPAPHKAGTGRSARQLPVRVSVEDVDPQGRTLTRKAPPESIPVSSVNSSLSPRSISRLKRLQVRGVEAHVMARVLWVPPGRTPIGVLPAATDQIT